MYKIRLLILLFISLAFTSCTNNNKSSEFQLSVAYISGEYDGLLLSNQLKSNLNNFGMLNTYSNYEIQGSISHSSNLFITNIDNTSDREKIESSIELKIYDKLNECFTLTFNQSISQFYILSASDRYTSNKTAVEEIKFSNTEYFVKKFINSLSKNSFVCDEYK